MLFFVPLIVTLIVLFPFVSGPYAAEYAVGTFHCEDAVVTMHRKYLPSKSLPNDAILFVVAPLHVEFFHVFPLSDENCHWYVVAVVPDGWLLTLAVIEEPYVFPPDIVTIGADDVPFPISFVAAVVALLML